MALRTKGEDGGRWNKTGTSKREAVGQFSSVLSLLKLFVNKVHIGANLRAPVQLLVRNLIVN
jgi:hypothetical protein